MRWVSGSAFLAGLLACTSPSLAADSSIYNDPETGFIFSQFAASFAIGKSLTFRVAVPSNATASTAYPVVLQVASPVEVGWTGLAWGGTMVSNPLTVSWANGNSAISSPRWASGHTTPTVYANEQIQVLKTGTHTNGTHWQITVKCTGCTSWTSSSGAKTVLNPQGQNRLAFAYSKNKPTTPSSSTSGFGVHEVTNGWTHDFAAANNPNFAALVAKNS